MSFLCNLFFSLDINNPIVVSDILTTLAGYPVIESFFPFQVISQLVFEKQLAMVLIFIY